LPALTLTLLLPLLLAGCRQPAATQVYVAPGVPFRLRPPEAGPEFYALQEVIFTLPGGRQETAVAAIENRGGVLSMVASTPVGQTLFSIRLQGSAVALDLRVGIPGDLDPRVLPALVEFALWPAAAVEKGLGPGIRFRDQGDLRELLRKDKVVWSVLREGDPPAYRRLTLENPALGLRVQIRTLEE
jgi:hypothetical protein